MPIPSPSRRPAHARSRRMRLPARVRLPARMRLPAVVVRAARRVGGVVVMLAVAASMPGPAAGQILWDAPRMMGPGSPGGVGVYWLRPDALPGDGDAVMATLPLPGAPPGVTLRGGAGEGVAGELAGFGGIDVRAPILRHDDAQPLDVEWNAGVGAGLGEYLVISVPVGVSAGRSWSSGSVWFSPYVGLGATMDYRRGDQAPDEELVVEPSGEVGVDLAFDRSRRFILRAAASLGDRQALALGLVVGGG